MAILKSLPLPSLLLSWATRGAAVSLGVSGLVFLGHGPFTLFDCLL